MSGLTPCPQLRPSSPREHVNASSSGGRRDAVNASSSGGRRDAVVGEMRW